MPQFEAQRPPESIGKFLGRTEYPGILSERISERRSRFERQSGHEITSVSALAHIFLEKGGKYIRAVYDEMPNGTPHLHPHMLGGFGLLSKEEQRNVKQAFTAVIIGASFLALTDMIERGMGTFDRGYFLSLYNVHMTGTGLPTLTEKDMPVPQNVLVNEDREEIIPEADWKGLQDRYQEEGFADFLGKDMWGSLPPSLQKFLNEQRQDFPDEVQKLYTAFAERARVLVKEDKKQQAERDAVLRRKASWFYEADLGFSLDP